MQGRKAGPLPRTARASRAFDLFSFWEGARGHFHFATKDWRANGGTWFDRGSLQQSDLHIGFTHLKQDPSARRLQQQF